MELVLWGLAGYGLLVLGYQLGRGLFWVTDWLSEPPARGWRDW